ncbi:hypothetical protein V2J09_015350 [Rumex salicifolius]
MEEKRDHQEEFKHVCKLCNKRYPSGKSLGGHMRSHVIADSYVSANKMKSKKAPTFVSNFNGGGDHLQADDCGGPGGSGYGLRENPKKTWRAEDSPLIVQQQQERICKQCGKGFQSLKALCGHMSCHSDKERKFSRLNGYDDDEEEEDGDEDEDDDEEDELWESEEEGEDEIKEIAMEGNDPKQRSTRYKAIAVVDSFSYGNGCSSNVTEIGHEQEEVAICLMMLSRDSVHHKVAAVNFTTESSDNNSVILEVIKKNADQENADGSLKMKQEAIKELKCVAMDNSDSGYFENGAKELESDGSVDWYARKYEFNKPKFKFGSGYVNVYDSEERDQAHLKRHLRSRNKSSNSFEANDLHDRGVSKKMKQEVLSSSQVNTKVCHKAGKYECWICQRTFKTHQALGGHIITHRRNKNGSRQEDYEQNLASKPEPSFAIKSSIAKDVNGSKKTKGHKCPFCPKVFRSGQALGGHKRSHLIGCSPQDKANLIQSVARNSAENNRQFLDLNLPAPVEEDGGGGCGGGGGNSQFFPCG